ncbi:MAG: leucine-rich repeat protein, partial [Ruminococcus sp.]
EYKFFAALGSYKGTATTVTLPTKISTETGTYNILKYYGHILANNNTVKKASIPDNNTKIQIPGTIFASSSTLEEVTIGSAVKSIYSAMFCDCTKLKTVNFTKEFLAQKPYIGAGAFTRCTSLRNLVLPNGISDVSADALVGCKNLNTITFGEDIKSCPITTDNVNLTNIKLLRKKSDVGFYSVNSGNGNHNCPINFNNSEVTVECYEGTLAAYDIANYYPTQGIKFSFTFKSLGKVDGDPYVPPTTEPPTTTAPYTVSVGEGDEWYLISSFNNWIRDDNSKMTYNPANNTFEKTYTVKAGTYTYEAFSPSCKEVFGSDGVITSNDPKFTVDTDNSTVKFVFDGIKVKMYINEQETTSTTVPPTTTSTTVPTTPTTTSTTVPSTSVTTSTTVPDTSVSETASVPSTSTIPTVTAGTLELEKTNDTLFVGKSREYKYTSSCNDPINYVKFVSSDNTIAQVNLNLNKDNTFTVVPLTKGTATITATLYDRDNREVTKSTFTVTVKQPVTKITIKANNKVVNNNVINIKKVNGRAKLNVSVAPANADNKNYSYSYNKNIISIDEKGNVKAKKIGFTNVTVKSNDSNLKTTVKVTVGDTATSIKIPLARFITTKNSKAKLNPTIYYKKYSNNKLGKDVFWKSSNNKVATVDSKGNVTAISNGWCYVQATAKDGSNKKSNNCLVVVGKNKVQSIKKTNYTQSKINVKKKHSITLKVEVKKINATYKNCNWSANNKLVKISNTKIYYSKDKKHCYVQAKVTTKKKGTCYVYCKTKDGSNKQLRYKIVIK